MRKAFNFYRSYYDVMLQLPESEQLAYIKAILVRQFTGEEQELDGLARKGKRKYKRKRKRKSTQESNWMFSDLNY